MKLTGAFLAENADDGAEKDLNIESDGPVLDIVDVEGATFVEGDIAAAGNLRKASEAGFDREDKTAITVVFKLDWLESARANKRDVATQNVDELRQLIERAAAKEVAELGVARVVFEEVAIGAVFGGVFRALAHFSESFFRGHATIFLLDATEFKETEAAIEAREANVAVDSGRMWLVDFLQNEYHEHNRRSDYEKNAGDNNINNAFVDAGGADKWSWANTKDWHAGQEVYIATHGNNRSGRRRVVEKHVIVDGGLIHALEVGVVSINKGFGFGFFDSFGNVAVLAGAIFFWDKFVTSDNGDDFEAGFWGDTHEKLCRVVAIANDDSADSAEAVAQRETVNGGNDGANEGKREEAEDDDIDWDGADWEKRGAGDGGVCEEIIGND